MKPTIYLIAISIFLPFLNANGQKAAPITANDLHAISNILYWNVEIPGDLEENEILTTQWRISDKQQEGNLYQASGLDFDGIPAGTKVKIFIWIPTDNENTKRLKYCLRYQNLYSQQQTVKGEFEVPKGFKQLYGFAPTGTWLSDSEGFIISLINGTSDNLCLLDFVYKKKSDPKTVNEGK